MKKLATLAILLAGPALADPLDLIDYPAIFAENAEAVEDISAARSALQMGDVILLHDPNEPREFTGIDESGEAAVGCFVSILATIESTVQACEVSLPAEQEVIQRTYLEEVLSFYAANVVPSVDQATVQTRFDALVASQIDGARPYCSNLDVMTDLADRLFSPDSRAEVTGMLSIPRLPVSNPCL
ncbi:hypothetical protein [Yoonia sp.]|uniref:hypothetical protein n=1 Tax=Yoonia sp. TaxID=2212373 RepID=UPI0023B53E08